MKFITRFIFILIVCFNLLSCNDKVSDNIEIDASLYITKTDVGFNIYSNKGILILEYTKRNCDSSSLITLD